MAYLLFQIYIDKCTFDVYYINNIMHDIINIKDGHTYVKKRQKYI